MLQYIHTCHIPSPSLPLQINTPYGTGISARLRSSSRTMVFTFWCSILYHNKFMTFGSLSQNWTYWDKYQWQSGFHHRTPLHAGPAPFHPHTCQLCLGLSPWTGTAGRARESCEKTNGISESCSRSRKPYLTRWFDDKQDISMTSLSNTTHWGRVWELVQMCELKRINDVPTGCSSNDSGIKHRLIKSQ